MSQTERLSFPRKEQPGPVLRDGRIIGEIRWQADQLVFDSYAFVNPSLAFPQSPAEAKQVVAVMEKIEDLERLKLN